MIQAFITGNIGKDAETRTAGQDTVTSFSMASNRKQKGEDVTTWIRCSLWGKRGTSLSQYLTKGSKVAVSGELSTREHEGKTYLELRVSEIDLMGGSKKTETKRAEPEDDATPGYTRHAVSDGEDLPF